jgi:hypothetical protein
MRPKIEIARLYSKQELEEYHMISVNPDIDPFLIYLASPYSEGGADMTLRHFRWLTTARIAARLMAEGKNVFSPIVHSHFIATEYTQMTGKQINDASRWQYLNAAMLDQANSIYVLTLDGWDRSSGVQHEIDYAKRCNKPIQYIDPR